jgi:hypothetical protein
MIRQRRHPGASRSLTAHEPHRFAVEGASADTEIISRRSLRRDRSGGIPAPLRVIAKPRPQRAFAMASSFEIRL